ncbi:MAG: hypothetical protein AAGC81_11595 [Pseudomonadota bacterium]
MAIAGTGNYFGYDGLIAQAGNLSDGALYVFGGAYEFAALDAGVNNGAGPASISGRITLSAAEVTVSDLFNQAGGGNGFALFASIGRSYDVNHAAYGKLSITTGSDLTLNPVAVYQPGVGVRGGYDTLNAGVGEGGTGVVEVSGIGSTFSTAGTNPVIRIGGAGGTGSLSVNNGADARIFSLQAGFGIASGTVATGNITVDGPDSRLLLSGSYGSYVNPAYAGFAGATTIGLAFGGPEGPNTGRGSLTISNGGEVIQQNIDGVTDFPLFRFGKDTLSSGTGLIEGNGSRLAIIQNGASGDDFVGGATLDIGEAGQGVVTVRDGGRIDVLGDKALLSVGRTPEGVPINGDFSTLTIESGGVVTVDAGGYEGGNVQIGSGPNSYAILSISGQESRLSLTSDAEGSAESNGFGATLLIGRVGIGTAEAFDGATIEIDGNDDRLPGVTIGSEGGAGSLSLTGATLSLSGTRTGAEAARITVGTDSGSGILSLSGGSVVTNQANDGRVLIGATTGSNGAVTIIDSSLTTGGDVLVGAGIAADGTPLLSEGGTGRLVLTEGATLNADNLIVGETGTVEITNATVTSDVTLAGSISLSPNEQSIETFNGQLTVSEGSQITAEVFDFQTGGSDQVIIQDPDSFRLADLPLSVDIKDNVTFFGGDSFVFGTTPTSFVSETRQIVDPANGRLFLLRAEGTDLSVEALFGSPVTLREDGTIGRIELPAIDRFLTEGSAIPDQFDFEI